MEVAHLYKITNKLTGDYYIGKHNGWKQNEYWGSGNRIKWSLAKYGKENFQYDILCYGSPKFILELEEKYVTLELIESDVKCLNLCPGGIGVSRFTEETRRKIGLASTSRQIGKKHKNTTKEKIRNSLKGKSLKEETKKIISDIFSKRVWVNNGIICHRIDLKELENYKKQGFFAGRLPLTEEHRKNIGKAVKGRKRKPESISKMKMTNLLKKEIFNG
jgi:hypothetical protein